MDQVDSQRRCIISRDSCQDYQCFEWLQLINQTQWPLAIKIQVQLHSANNCDIPLTSDSCMSGKRIHRVLIPSMHCRSESCVWRARTGQTSQGYSDMEEWGDVPITHCFMYFSEIYLKGQYTQKWKFTHHLLSLK